MPSATHQPKAPPEGPGQRKPVLAGAQRQVLPHTVVGYATHHAASLFWAALLSAFLRSRPAMNTVPRTVAACFATSAIACVVDFQLTPQRLTPGYEHRLSRKAPAVTYLLFGVGLALGSLVLGAASGAGRQRDSRS